MSVVANFKSFVSGLFAGMANDQAKRIPLHTSFFLLINQELTSIFTS
jgi:hypothetical protein